MMTAKAIAEKHNAGVKKPAGVGHNSAPRFAKDQLKAVVERVEKLAEERQAVSADIKDVYAEAKATGFDVKAIKTIVRMRKMDAAQRKEQEAVLETYLIALGMLD